MLVLQYLLCVLVVLAADIYARYVSEPKEIEGNQDRYAGTYLGLLSKSLFMGLILAAIVGGIQFLIPVIQ